jgi:hypothetical protein
MRSFVCLLLSAVCLAGCASPKWSSEKTDQNGIPGAPTEKKPHDKLIVTPELALTGTVVRVNESARFVVLNFPVGSLPGAGAQMNVYRHGAKIGTLRITAMQLDDNIVADVTDGIIQAGDEVRGN